MDKWFILINPAAAGKKAAKQWPHVSRLLYEADISFQHRFSTSAEDAVEQITTAIRQGYRNLVAVGGDGTLNLVINGIFQQTFVDTREIVLAIIPVGTGNDWIRTHKIPKTSKAAVALISAHKTALHDVGKITFTGRHSTVKYFINMAGFGFQGLVAERIEGVSSGIKKGIFAFVLGIFDALFRYKITQVAIEMDDMEMNGMIYNMNAGICRYCGGGMKMAPDAVTDDGMFDVTIVRKISKGEVILNIPGLFSGKFLKHKKVSSHRMKKMKIKSNPFLPVECDGEVLGYGDVLLEIMEKGVRVIVP